MKQYTKRILSFLIAALLAFGVAIPAAHAALDNNIHIITMGGEDGIFEFFNGLEWKSLVVPFWMEMNDENVAYCLESNKTQPMGDGYHIAQALYS